MKRLVLVAVAVGLLCACGSGHSAARHVAKGPTRAKGPTGRSVSQRVPVVPIVYTPHTKAAAKREAQRLLAAFVPPPGAVRIKAVPKGDHPPVTGTGGILGTSVKLHRLWLVHLPAKFFVRYFFHRLHGWHGAIAHGTLHGQTIHSVMGASVTYAEVGFGGRATERVLNIAAAKSHRAGWSLLRAAEAVAWHLSAAEREDIPAGVSEIDIRGPRGKTSVTNRNQVRTIVRWFNHLPLGEASFGGVSSWCATQQQTLTFTFRGRHGTVARMSVPSGGCSTARYTIPRQWQTPLSAGDLDRRVQKLLGVRLTSASR